MELICDAVFEGGGVKGIGLVGAVCGAEAAGYSFRNVAGTSAGAIVASLLGVGYTGSEIKAEMMKLDFKKFRGEDWLTKTGAAGKMVKLALKNGVYKADYLDTWLDMMFKRKGKTCFGDIRAHDNADGPPAYRFQAIASDLSNSRMLVLPRDLKLFGLDPDQFGITSAVRMSMSIPLFYEPYVLTDMNGLKHVIVDGGLLSNYPMWLMDEGKTSASCPTFGFKFCTSTTGEPEGEDYAAVNWLPGLLKSLVRTSMDAHDKHYISISNGDFRRTIPISTIVIRNGKEESISTVDFGISPEDQEALFQNGLRAAKTFIRTWSFENWKSTYGGGARKNSAAR